MIVSWRSPKTVPEVEVGTEKEYWISIYSAYAGEELTFLAMYQNRPLSEGEELETPYGEAIESIGWVTCKSHYEFDDFYEEIQFDDKYILTGWAEYTPPNPPRRE